MTAAEEGVLLLCSRLGDPESRPLTIPQFRKLGDSVRALAQSGDPLRELNGQDLMRLGCDEALARRVMELLRREDRLRLYLRQAGRQDIAPLTWISPGYPRRFVRLQGHSCPPVLFYRGDLRLLERPSVAVVGSRKLNPENEAFAKEAGRLAAEEGLVLVSGGANGADLTAQNACLEAGGSCVIFVADRLTRYPGHDRVLYVSADGFDLPFSTPRALARNHLIHMQGDKVLAAQCTFGSGGTWQGCLENLRHGWSDLFVYEDGSAGAKALAEQGATPVHRLNHIRDLQNTQVSLF